MRTGHKQMVRDENQKAHFQKIGQDLSEVSKILTRELSKKDSLLVEIKNLEQTKINLIETNETLVRDSQNRISASLFAEQSLKELEHKFNKYKMETEKELQSKLIDADNQLRSVTSNIGDALSKLDALKKEIKGLENKQATIIESIVYLEKDLSNLNKKKNTLEDEIVTLETELINITFLLKDKKVFVSKELLLLEDQLNKKKESLLLPERNLKVREEQFEKKRADLDIYAAQVKRFWDKLFPGKEMKL